MYLHVQALARVTTHQQDRAAVDAGRQAILHIHAQALARVTIHQQVRAVDAVLPVVPATRAQAVAHQAVLRREEVPAIHLQAVAGHLHPVRIALQAAAVPVVLAVHIALGLPAADALPVAVLRQVEEVAVEAADKRILNI